MSDNTKPCDYPGPHRGHSYKRNPDEDGAIWRCLGVGDQKDRPVETVELPEAAEKPQLSKRRFAVLTPAVWEVKFGVVQLEGPFHTRAEHIFAVSVERVIAIVKTEYPTAIISSVVRQDGPRSLWVDPDYPVETRTYE